MIKRRFARNRTERKAQYIRVKNRMTKYPECGGDFYCDQQLNQYGLSYGADFQFLHTTQKRYYACSLQTCELEAYVAVEERALDLSSLVFPYQDDLRRYDPMSEHRKELFDASIREQLKPVMVAPSMLIKDYGPVAIGLWATVNTTHVDEQIIREFIKRFRSMGEPTTPGWFHKDAETQVDPRKLLRTETP